MEYKHLDLNYLHRMSGGNYTTIKELSSMFILEVPIMIESLEELIGSQDLEGIKNLAHKSKSTLSIFGMQQLAEEMNNFEKLAKNGEDKESYKEKLELFKLSSKEAVEELNDFLASQ